MRKLNFENSVNDGRIFECIVCHRILFKNGVKVKSKTFHEELDNSCPGLFERAVGTYETSKSGLFYICITCDSYVKKGKVPPMSNQNNLQLFDITNHPKFQLTELENCMIALNIIFQNFPSAKVTLACNERQNS